MKERNMADEIVQGSRGGDDSPFQRIRRVNPAGNEYWSSREFAELLGYTDYRNFVQVIQKAKTACFNSGRRLDDHFVEVTDMIEIGKGGREAFRPFICRDTPAIWSYRMRIPGRRSWHWAKVILRFRHDGRSLRMQPLRKNGDC
jgi:DNA-damage-inducible protein D